MTADRLLFTITSTLIGISVILSYSLSAYITLLFDTNQFHFAIRQAGFAFLSIIIMFILSNLNPDKHLKSLGFLLFFSSIILMIVMPFLPDSLVHSVGGAKRWIKIFGFSLAPVEFFKIGFIYFLAWSFSRKLGNHKGIGVMQELIRFAPYGFVFVVAMIIIAVVQNDLGQVIVLGLTLLFMLVFAGSSFRFFLTILLLALISFTFFIITSDHRIMRIKSWWIGAQNMILSFLPPSMASKLKIVTTESESYQIGHSLNAIHNGGFFGTGIGNGTFKLGFLSEVHTDFILAGLTEEFGFIGLVLVVFLFLWLIQRIFKIANHSKDDSLYLFSLGIGLMLSFEFLVNAYGISGLFPIKGISVPFLSYGGSAIIAASVGVGMVLMASKKTDINVKKGLE